MSYTYDSDSDSYFWQDDNYNTPADSYNLASQSDSAGFGPPPPADTPSNGSDGWWSTIGIDNAQVREAIEVAFGKPGESNMANAAAYGTTSSPEAMRIAAAEPEQSFFDRLKSGAGKAWDKDPMKVLEFLGGTLGGAYLADQKRKEAAALRQSRMEEQNNAAAIKKSESDAYAASFDLTRKRAPIARKPLTRMDGSRVFGADGKLNRG